jgi:hypothetical protein
MSARNYYFKFKAISYPTSKYLISSIRSGIFIKSKVTLFFKNLHSKMR